MTSGFMETVNYIDFDGAEHDTFVQLRIDIVWRIPLEQIKNAIWA
jgi:hypothetical protein